jgi:hypothetical protein
VSGVYILCLFPEHDKKSRYLDWGPLTIVFLANERACHSNGESDTTEPIKDRIATEEALERSSCWADGSLSDGTSSRDMGSTKLDGNQP